MLHRTQNDVLFQCPHPIMEKNQTAHILTHFTGKSMAQQRNHLKVFVENHSEWIREVGGELIRKKGQNFDDYLKDMVKPGFKFDEITLLCFARMHHKHIFVLMEHRFWTTRRDNDVRQCYMKFAYTGNLLFLPIMHESERVRKFHDQTRAVMLFLPKRVSARNKAAPSQGEMEEKKIECSEGFPENNSLKQVGNQSSITPPDTPTGKFSTELSGPEIETTPPSTPTLQMPVIPVGTSPPSTPPVHACGRTSPPHIFHESSDDESPTRTSDNNPSRTSSPVPENQSGTETPLGTPESPTRTSDNNPSRTSSPVPENQSGTETPLGTPESPTRTAAASPAKSPHRTTPPGTPAKNLRSTSASPVRSPPGTPAKSSPHRTYTTWYPGKESYHGTPAKNQRSTSASPVRSPPGTPANSPHRTTPPGTPAKNQRSTSASPVRSPPGTPANCPHRTTPPGTPAKNQRSTSASPVRSPPGTPANSPHRTRKERDENNNILDKEESTAVDTDSCDSDSGSTSGCNSVHSHVKSSCNSSCFDSETDSDYVPSDVDNAKSKKRIYSDQEDSQDAVGSSTGRRKLRKTISGPKPNYVDSDIDDGDSIHSDVNEEETEYVPPKKPRKKKGKSHVTETTKGLMEIEKFGLVKSKEIRQRNYKCQYCDHTCTKQTEHNTHVKETHPDEKLACFHCDKKFELPTSLYKHERSHYNLKYGCSECEKRFQFPYQAKSHMKIHSKKSLFPCLHCTRQFTTNANMLVHAKTHNEVFKCTQENCPTPDKIFNSKGNLDQHIRGQHGPGWQALCGFSCKWKSKYNRHLEHCEECPKLRAEVKKKRYHFL